MLYNNGPVMFTGIDGREEGYVLQLERTGYVRGHWDMKPCEAGKRVGSQENL